MRLEVKKKFADEISTRLSAVATSKGTATAKLTKMRSDIDVFEKDGSASIRKLESNAQTAGEKLRDRVSKQMATLRSLEEQANNAAANRVLSAEAIEKKVTPGECASFSPVTGGARQKNSDPFSVSPRTSLIGIVRI